MLYCIEIYRDSEEPMVVHESFDEEPSRKDVLEYIDTLDCGYNDDYGKFYCYCIG